MYEIGDKVELDNEMYIIKGLDGDLAQIINGHGSRIVYVSELTPYRTAHEKLIEMGYEEKIHDTVVKNEVESGRYKQYVKGSEVILIDVENRDFTTYILYNGDKGVSDVSWVNHKLSRILTEYLEEITNE